MTRAAVIESLLAELQARKERAVVVLVMRQTALPSPDFDEVREECAGCGNAEPLARMKQCPHCGMWFCDHRDADCSDAHMEMVRIRRRG